MTVDGAAAFKIILNIAGLEGDQLSPATLEDGRFVSQSVLPETTRVS